LRLITGPTKKLINEIRLIAPRYQGGRARIVVAWAKDKGVRWLLSAIEGHINTLEMIVGLNEKQTTVEALIRLLQKTDLLFAFFKHPRQTFHPKIYWFDVNKQQTTTVIVGSSNLTLGGLFTNFETSIITEIDMHNPQTGNHEFLNDLNDVWQELTSSPYAYQIRSVDDIQVLYEKGYIVTEKTLLRRNRQELRTEQPNNSLPTSPPPKIMNPPGEPIDIPFPVLVMPPAEVRRIERRGTELEQIPDEDTDPTGIKPLPYRFYVRTLTINDVNKLKGRTPGTFEPDLGQTARDKYPSFWGWPDMYQEVTRLLLRKEWRIRGLLISSLTPPEGINVIVTLWFRDARPKHAGEHRIGLSPIDDIRNVTPREFDEKSFLVIERAPEGVDYQFILRLVTDRDLEYNDYSTYLIETRPHHKYGYGP